MKLFLTEKGKEMKQKVEEQWKKIETETFRGLTPPEKIMFSMLLEKFLKE